MLEIVSSLKFSQLLNQATTESLITVEADGTVSVRDGAATYLKEITLGLPSVLYASSSLNFTPANTAQSLNLAVQTAGNIFAAPAAVNGSPSFRALVASDIPGLDASKIISGTFSDTFISSAAVWNAKQDALVSGTNIKTVGGQTILGSGDITLASLNYWTKTGFVLSYESTDNATGKATFNGGFEIYSTAPNHSLKQRVTMQTWRTQIGANTGAAGGSYYSIFNVTGGNHGLTVTTDGNVAIGTLPTSESSSNSRLYVYGGATGANIDVRGLDVAFKDQATLELQGSEYSTAYSSTRLQHRGANYGTSVSILGLVTQNFGELTFQEVSGAVIRSTNTTPILVGINNLEVARFLVGGFKVTGSIEYSTTLKPNGNAGTSGYFLKTTGTTNSWSAITLADISDYSAANINYWTLASGNVYRATGKVFVGNSTDLGAYSFQVTGDTVLAGKLNIGNVPNPGAQLEVYGGANFRYPSSDNSAMYVRMGTYISSGLYGTFLKSDSYYAGTLVTNLHLGITDGSATDKILISLIGSTSFVGINTVNPNSRLDVNGDLRVVNGGKFTGQAGTWYNGGQILIDYASSQGRIQAYDGSNSTVKDLLLQWNGGNVGIGASPNSKLHVNGVNARFWLSDSTQNSYYTYFHLDPANGRTLVQAGDSIAYRDIVMQYLGGKLLVGTQSTFTGDTLQVNGSILQRNTFNAIIRADSNGTLSAASQSDIMGVLGESAYIKNQYNNAQNANAWISGDFRANGFVKAGRKGFYGSYDYTEVQGIWSIAEGYPIDTTSNTFGNQYGIVYGYEYGTTGTSKRPLTGYSHQILFVGNGVVYSAISMDTGKAFFNGYVGVGLSDAQYYLDSAGSIRLRNQSQIYFDTPSSANSNYIGITNSYWTTIYAGRGNTSRIDLTNANGILFSTNTYERFRIEVDGKVLINTSSAYNGSVLQVNGSILQRNVIASSILKVLAADSNGTIVEGDQAAVMGVLGDSAYIKNQNGAIQTGNFRISSVGRAAEFYADAVGGNIYAAFGWLRNSYTQFYLYTYGNTENDLRLARYTDVGGYAGNVFIVYRATGKMYFDNSVRIGGGEGSSSYRLDVAETLRVGGQGGTDVTTIGGGSGVGSYLNMYYADGTVNNVLTGNGINALSSYLGGTIIGGFSYSNNNAKLIVRGSSMGNTATGTSSNKAVQISNTDIAYGLHFGVNSNGNSWIQSGRADSTTKYDLWLQHEGSSVIIGNTAAYGSYKLQVFGDIWTNSYLHIRNTSPTILFSDTDNRGAAIHVNSNLLYILRLDDAGTSWQTNSTGLWPFYINLENNNARFGGEIQQEYVKSSLVYANVAGTLIPASAQNVKDLLGDGAYIKNQFAGAQSGNFWVNGTSRVGLYGTTGTTPVFAVTGTHANTSFSLYSIGNGTLDSSLDMWASEPGFTYDGCGIGHNINNNPYGGRRNTSLGQSYIRFYGGHIYISTSGSERTNPSTSAWRFDAGGIFYWGGSANNGQLTWDSGYAALHSINGNRLLLGVAGADTSLMTLTTSAKVLIGTTEENSYKVHINSGSSTGDGLYVYGKIFATDDIQSYSDKRLKENFKDIIIGNKLKDFKIQQYNKIGSHRLQIGVIAQELAEIFPQLVSKEGAYFGVSYSGVATLALGLGIENKNEIEELKEKVLSLQKEIEDLKLK